MKGSRSVFPMPEAIREDRVRIESGTGSMDNTGKVMRVPLGDSPADRHVRAHEMAHAKYSPLKPEGPKGVHPQAIQRAEDMRMNYYCRQAGLDEALNAPIADEAIMGRLVAGPLLRGDVLSAVTAAASCFNTGDWPECMDAIRAADADLPAGKRVADRIEEFIPSLWPSGSPEWADALDIARRLCEFANPPGEDSGEDSEPGEGEGGVPIDLSGDPLDDMVDVKLAAEAAEAAPTDPVEAGIEALTTSAKYMSKGGEAIGANRVTIRDREIPKPKRVIPSRIKGRAPKPREFGMVPKHVERYCTDGYIFAGKGRRRVNGGAILIDVSGSMSITIEDLDKLLDAAPGGVVATYCGAHGEGGINVVVRNGKRTNDPRQLIPPYRCGNHVDIEALEWLAREPDPVKYWVCDGMVSGCKSAKEPDADGEYFGKAIFARCIELCREHRIVRVDSIADLVALIG